MGTRIKSITGVNSVGTSYYEVGGVYNGLKVETIEDWSLEFPDAWEFIYRGYDKNKDVVFEIINVPVDIKYEAGT